MTLDPLQRRLLSAFLLLASAALALWIAGSLLALVALVSDVVLVFVVAWIVTYLLSPLVGAFERRARVGRIGAVSLAYVVVVLALAVALAVIVPPVAAQLAAFVVDAPQLAERMTEQVRGLQAAVDARGIPLDISGAYAGLPQRLAVLASERAADVVGLVGGVVALLVSLTFVLVASFFMLVDGDRLWRAFVRRLHGPRLEEAELLREALDRSFGGYVRGQLLLGAVYGALTWLFLVIVGIPFAALLGVISGFLMVIPVFGAMIATLPPLIVAAPQGAAAAAITFAGIFAVQFVLMNFIAPRLMARAIGVHPLVVLLALLLGAKLAGFWGVFLALPVAGILNVIVRYAYREATGAAEPAAP